MARTTNNSRPRHSTSGNIDTIPTDSCQIRRPNVVQETDTGKQSKYRLHDEQEPDERLPFISKEEVECKQFPKIIVDPNDPVNYSERECWIVINGIVYDCSEFITEHPGGEQSIASFIGEDCSWQFWRFHGEGELAQYGRGLRIGRTEGVKNRFAEPRRFVGLSSLGNDSW